MSNGSRWPRLGMAGALAVAASFTCAAAVLLFFEAPIWWDLSNAAAECFGNADDWKDASLYKDVKKNLQQYGPQRIARYLKSPAEKWRGVVCLALKAHADRDPAHWTGVPAALARTAVATENEQLTVLCFDALLSAPEYSATDVRSIVDALVRKPTRKSAAVLEALASRSRQGRTEMKAAMWEWLEGSFEPGRAAAFGILARFFPEEDDATAAYAVNGLKGGEVDHQAVAGLKALLSRRPAVGNHFVEGAPGEKHVLWLALAKPSASASANAPPNDPQLVAAAEQAAANELAGHDAGDLEAIVRFLGATPHGFSILFRNMESRNDAFIRKVLEELHYQY